MREQEITTTKGENVPMITRMRDVRATICFLILAAFAVAVLGCASTATHPGAANSTDSQLYDSLISIQASIEQAKIDFVTNPDAKPYLNKLITAYNVAQDTYRTYHQHVINGQNPDTTDLNTQISTLLSDLAKLQSQFGGAH